jgi:hypothetical protein
MVGFIVPFTYADHWDVCTEIEFDGNNRDEIRNCWNEAEKQHDYQEEHLQKVNERHSQTYLYQTIALGATIGICSVIAIVVIKFVILKKK